MTRSLKILVLGISFSLTAAGASADDAKLRDDVKRAIARAQQFLVSQQLPDGSWSGQTPGGSRAGADALVLLALANSGLEASHPTIRSGLAYLRKVPEPEKVYDMAVMIMALAAVNDGRRDAGLIARLAQGLEEAQLQVGHPGAWWYDRASARGGSWDNSNTQFALLGLREAAHATGYPVDRTTWRRSRDHWLRTQIGNREGVGGAGWAYSLGGSNTTGSMTVAGIASLTIIQSFLREEPPDGRLDCCGDAGDDEVQQAIDAGVRWLGSRFRIRSNPEADRQWALYYLYGLERAGRLSGRRFFGDHDWYREGAQYLVSTQTPGGAWRPDSSSPFESDPVYGTAYVLLFLSKGLAPVLVNKLKFGPRDPLSGEPLSDDWNRHRGDARNLVDFISGRDHWPKLLTWQVVDLDKAAAAHDVQALLQAPVQLLSGRDAPRSIDGPQLELLREYVAQGGFLFAVQNCESADFDEGFRDMIKRMFPTGEFRLRRLPETHDVYRSEFLLDENPPELWGVDLGCRTAIVYAPFDHACRWDHWVKIRPPDRKPDLQTSVVKSMQVGTNVIAYATNREVHDKLDGPEAIVQSDDFGEARGTLRIARIRHRGGWDTARNALRHLYDALEEKVALRPAVRTVNLALTDESLFEYPLLYMHGRQTFSFSPAEREQLLAHLEHGGLLFADACCGAEAFDRSFRELVDQLFGREMERIPITHELFRSELGFDVRRVERRLPVSGRDSVLDTETSMGEPVLEGIEIDGRLAIVYSKYDVSCALERQATAACAGYSSADATKLAVNVVLYSFVQQFRKTAADR